MQELIKKLKVLEEDFLKAYERLDITHKAELLAKLEQEVAEPEIWRDVKLATEKKLTVQLMRK